MPETKTIQTAFDSGQYSPRMDGRVDVEGYRNACKRLQNFIVFPQGGAITRSGSKYIADTKLGDIEAGDITTTVYTNKSKSVAAQEATPSGVAFSDDGLNMYVIGETNNTVYQFALRIARDVSTANLINKSKDVSAQVGGAHDVVFGLNGTKMFVLDANGVVFQYTLSTPWDVSTATYDSKSVAIAELSSGEGMSFKSDGLRLFVIGLTSPFNASVFQYTLSTPWDVSTATTDSVSIAVTAQEDAPSAMSLNSTGTIMYVMGFGAVPLIINQYTLSSAWDLSTASFASKTFSASEASSPRGMFFASNDLDMYLVGDTNDTVFQYRLHTGITRLMPFVVSGVSPYVLEFGNEYIRFYKAGAQFFDGASPVEVTSPYLDSEVFELDFAQTNDVIYITHINHAPRKLSRINDIEWKLHEVNFDTEPLIDDFFTIDDVSGITRLATPAAFAKNKTAIFSDTDNTNFSFIDGDIGRILFAGQRQANILWAKTGSVTQQVFGKIIDEFLDADTAFDVSELSIAGTPFGSLNPSAAGAIGDVITLTSNVNGKTAAVLVTPANWVKSSVTTQYYWNVNPTTEPDEVAWHGDFLNKNTAGLAAGIEIGEWGYGDVGGEVGFNTIYIRTPLDTDPDLLDTTQNTNAILRVDDTGSAAQLFRKEDEGKYVQINEGLVLITTFIDATSIRGRVLQALDSADATTVWALLTSYWGSADNPGAVVFHEGRLVFGGSPTFPNTFWGSEVAQFERFQPGTDDGDSYTFTLNARKTSFIRWLESRDVMIAGLEDGEWQIGLRNGIITPSSVFVRRQTIHGCANIQSVVAEKSILFVERGGDKLRELNFNFEGEDYIAADKTLLSEDVGGASGFKQIDVQNRPFPVVWAVNNDGELVGMTYIRDQNLSAWHVHKTGATAAGASDGSDSYESVAVIPNLADETVDEVWVVVKRTIDGSDVRFVERFEKPLDKDAVPTDARMLDAFTLQETTSTTVSGLDRFDNDVVIAIRDGDPDKISEHTVTAGSITIEAPATNVVVGLPYKPLIQTMRPAVPGPTGTSQAQIGRVSKVWLRLFNTLGLKCGATEAGVTALNLIKSSQVNEDDYYTFANNGFFEGDVEFGDYAGGNNRQNFVFIVQDQPLPATITALIMAVDTT